jgi:hypothetical protein
MVYVDSKGVITENKGPLRRLVPKKDTKIADIEQFVNDYLAKDLKEGNCPFDPENIDFLIGYKNSDAYVVLYFKEDVSSDIELLKKVDEAKKTGVYEGEGVEDFYKSIIQEENTYYLLYAYTFHFQYNFADRNLTGFELKPETAYTVERMINRSNEAIKELTGDEIGLQEDIFYYIGKEKSIYEKAYMHPPTIKGFDEAIGTVIQRYSSDRLKDCDNKSNVKMLYLSTMFDDVFNPVRGATFDTFEKLKKFFSANSDRLTYKAEHLHFKDDRIIFTVQGKKECCLNESKYSDEIGAYNFIKTDYRGLDAHSVKNEEITIHVRKDMYGNTLYLMNGLYISGIDELKDALMRANSFSKVEWYNYDKKLQDYILNHDNQPVEQKPVQITPTKDKQKKKGFNVFELRKNLKEDRDEH